MKLALLSILLLFSINIKSQNTIGIITNTANAYNAYTLFTAEKNTYLINNCGEVVHSWTSTASSSKMVYLLENGNLLRNANALNSTSSIIIPGKAGRIELFDWDNNLLWSYEYSDDNHTQHHDIFPMPNGNILMITASVLTAAEAIQLGRNIANLTDNKLYNEQILEIQPVGINDANIVWQWDIKDHLIQDLDNSQSNFGDVSQNPQLLDINYLGTAGGAANWLHCNSVQYNATLDQIILSTRKLSEFYIIDHSTTTVEAASSTGGTYNKGGDFLYRWGNPQAYKQGLSSDQQLFGQHYPHWIAPGLQDAGKILIFNNGFNRTPSFSEIFKITPPTSAQGVYSYTTNTAYGPSAPDYKYEAPVKTDLYTPILSSAQELPNGNILITVGDKGRIFEIDSNKDVVWEYINPAAVNGIILSQGDNPLTQTRILFRAFKYAPTYAAFTGKTLTPGNPIELNPNTSACQILKTNDESYLNLSLSPNPVEDILKIQSTKEISKTEIYNTLGKLVKRTLNNKTINLSYLSSGLYFIKIFSEKSITTRKIVKN